MPQLTTIGKDGMFDMLNRALEDIDMDKTTMQAVQEEIDRQYFEAEISEHGALALERELYRKISITNPTNPIPGHEDDWSSEIGPVQTVDYSSGWSINDLFDMASI